jgi:regulator of replication initiation timing
MAKRTTKKDETSELVKLESKIQSQTNQIKSLNQKLKSAYRKNNILTVFEDELKNNIKPLTKLPTRPIINKKAKYKEDLVIHISDQHADQIVLPEQVGGLENYDFNVALCRAETYVDKTLEYIYNMKNYEFENVWILMYGDLVSGEIHGAEKESYYRNMFKNSIAVAKMNSLMIRDFASYFKKINVICLTGNHGRRTLKKDFYNPQNNWDYLVYQTMKMSCENIPNINFTIPNSYSIVVEINGHNFFIAHGDQIKSYNSIPYYGIERKTRRLIALNSSQGRHINYYVFGHFHTGSSMSHLNGETIINGSWLGTDPYAYDSLSVFNKPKQWIHGVDKKYGISWRMDVHLKDEKKEKKGPERYKVEL